MKTILALFLVLTAQAHAPKSAEWNLVWSDEFEADGRPDPMRWTHETDVFVNDEAQIYTDRAENSWQQGGQLVLEARKEEHKGYQYTSARLITKGHGQWTYGRFEARIMLPTGRGTWPAFWMMPAGSGYGNGDWPDNGEIDILEHVGYDPGFVHTSLHTNSLNWMNNNQPTAKTFVPEIGAGFHVYALEWTPWELTAYVDGVQYFRHPNPRQDWTVWPFDRDFYLILNLAIGGNWGGKEGIDNSVFPQRMLVDYVRVFARASQ